MENTDSFKAMTIHEYHSYVVRCFDCGLIDERKKKFRLENVNTFVNNNGLIYIHTHDIQQLVNAENKN